MAETYQRKLLIDMEEAHAARFKMSLEDASREAMAMIRKPRISNEQWFTEDNTIDSNQTNPMNSTHIISQMSISFSNTFTDVPSFSFGSLGRRLLLDGNNKSPHVRSKYMGDGLKHLYG